MKCQSDGIAEMFYLKLTMQICVTAAKSDNVTNRSAARSETEVSDLRPTTSPCYLSKYRIRTELEIVDQVLLQQVNACHTHSLRCRRPLLHSSALSTASIYANYFTLLTV